MSRPVTKEQVLPDLPREAPGVVMLTENGSTTASGGGHGELLVNGAEFHFCKIRVLEMQRECT